MLFPIGILTWNMVFISRNLSAAIRRVAELRKPLLCRGRGEYSVDLLHWQMMVCILWAKYFSKSCNENEFQVPLEQMSFCQFLNIAHIGELKMNVLSIREKQIIGKNPIM